MLDRHLTMKNQVINLVRTANFELWRINSIRHYLSVESTQKLVLAFVMSRLDYCTLFSVAVPSTLSTNFRKFKTMLHTSCWRFLKLTILCHTYKQTLHWLPVNAKIQYKMCSLCFSAINSSGPQYLADLLKIYAPSCHLRSSADTCALCILSVHKRKLWPTSLFTLCTYSLEQSF